MEGVLTSFSPFVFVPEEDSSPASQGDAAVDG
jgi:hypothetical protein